MTHPIDGRDISEATAAISRPEHPGSSPFLIVVPRWAVDLHPELADSETVGPMFDVPVEVNVAD